MATLCESRVRRIAGLATVASIGLAQVVHPWLIGIAAFVGLNLLQSSFTDICPAERLLPGCDA